MTTHHPDLAAEQQYLDHAYACLEAAREDAFRMRALTEVGRGGTHQARYERDVVEEAIHSRLSQLDLHDAALVFGRIDRQVPAEVVAGNGHGNGEGGAETESFHIGRIAVSDEHREPVVIDWRAPVAEPFYRATGREPMGLVRRRHFSVRGRQLLALEDELFGASHLGIGSEGEAPFGLRGYSTLIAALERSRTGKLGDIVATIQSEQDEIIRSPQAGVLVVQGGPGTGKTVVALHRAAYLLYTFRFPLEDQGVLVIGPNRVFLRYIERVLPSLGEAGVEQVVLSDLVPDVHFGAPESQASARVKGDVRMAQVLAKAVRDRGRPLREDLVVPFGLTSLRVPVAETERIVQAARRRYRRHNAARRFVEGELFAALAASSRDDLNVQTVRERTRHTDEIRVALERMWPVLTPDQLLHDLFGAARAPRPGRFEVVERSRAGRPLPPPLPRRGSGAVVRSRRRPPRRGPRPPRAPLLPPETGEGRRRRGQRRDPDLWAHRDRRGAGPLAHAAAYGGATFPQRLHDRGRGHRAGHGRACAT